jgi:hypothetical protein
MRFAYSISSCRIKMRTIEINETTRDKNCRMGKIIGLIVSIFFRFSMATNDNNYSTFFDWLTTNGGQHHAHIRIDTRDQRGLFTSNTIESHTALVRIPRSLIINRQHADLSSIPVDTDRLALMIFLLREHHQGIRSSWYPWLHLLNIDEHATSFLKKQMCLFDCLEHSTLGQALTVRYQELHDEYEQIRSMFDTSLDVVCTIDHLVWSRALDLSNESSLSLIPLIDFANHR